MKNFKIGKIHASYCLLLTAYGAHAHTHKYKWGI